MIPEVSNILKDDFVHNKDHYEQPVCDLAKPKFFELEVIDELSVSFLKTQWCVIEMQHLLHKPYVNEVTLNGQNLYLKSY